METYRPKIRLDYSCPALERERENQAEKRRRQKLDDYNEATFGRRHLIRSAVLRRVGLLLLLILLALFLPGLLPLRVSAGVAVIALVLWEGLHCVVR